MSKHGIAVREKATKKLVEFIECETGRGALQILSGIRINLNHAEYSAEEDFVEQNEIDEMKKRGAE